MTIQERIYSLRQWMKKRRIDVYVVPSGDFHQSEYVGDYFKAREYITGFTGSAGTAVITQAEAGLWTDGRYFIQAEQELIGTDIVLFKCGNPGVINIEEYIEANLPENGTLAFDGRVFSASEGQSFENLVHRKNGHILYAYDLVDLIWENRPSLPVEPIYELDEIYTGESSISKMRRLRDEMRILGVTSHLLAALDDIAWLFNLRGNDVAYTPVFLSFAVITMDTVHLFVDKEKLSIEIQQSLKHMGVQLHPYEEVYDFVFGFQDRETILLDPRSINYTLYQQLSCELNLIERANPTVFMKSVKNEVEIANLRKAHLKDAIAHTKFLYWLKNNYQIEKITELSAAAKLETLRSEQEHFLSPSFAPISAYGTHAAMCHYSSSEKTNVVLKEGSLYLTDTGGHYLEGSTDITRTVALGKIKAEWKRHYTSVLRGNLALANATFLYGCTGENLDILARQFLWSDNLDYKHGTGHGIGYLLSVHEGPCSIKWQYRQKPYALEAGMILSDEPGIYIENSHGIRLENDLLVCKDIQNEYGQFMKFETLTLVPFDLDAIDASLLHENEKEMLNTYHQKVYEAISPHLNDAENEWLRQYTRAI